MNKRFEFIDHTADIAVRVYGEELSELFRNAFYAWQTIVTKDKPHPDTMITINLQADSPEELLVDFLTEVNVLLLTKKMFVVSIDKLNILVNSTSYNLSAKVNCINISESNIIFDTEIKAVTYHQLKIKMNKKNFSATIVFDI